MARRTYDEAAAALVRAIDIGEEVLTRASKVENRDDLVAFGKETRRMALSPEPAFRKVASLRYLEDAFFTYWNESAGKHIATFWKRIAEAGLPYRPRDIVREVLDRGRIRNRQEYDNVQDWMVVGEQEGRFTAAESETLSRLLGEYEGRGRKGRPG